MFASHTPTQAAPLSQFITKSVISDNMRILERQCEKIRTRWKVCDPIEVCALAAFHELVAKATGEDTIELRTDRNKMLEHFCDSTADFKDPNEIVVAGTLKRLGFKSGLATEEEASIRQTGRTFPLSHILKPEPAPPPLVPHTRCSTFSGLSKW